MPSARRVSLVSVAALLAVLACATCAVAAPITVNLRVEGSSKTLYEGPVTTEPQTFETASSGGPHACDYSDNGNSGGFTNGGNPSATPTDALRTAALASGLAFNAEWSTEFGDFDVTQVGSDADNSNEFWGYAVDDTTAPVGGCQIALAPGNEVLWAFNYFGLEHLLSLSGPSTANVGTPFTVHVVDGQTGAPIQHASIGEDVAGVTTAVPGVETNAEGNATVTLSNTGSVTLKATEPKSVRSNGIVVCVHNGDDGTCGTTPRACADSASSATGECSTAPFHAPPAPSPRAVPRVRGVANGQVFRRGHGPRLLRGEVELLNGDTLHTLSISLQRRYRGRCYSFSGARERFARSRCGTSSYFSVGGSLSFSYLLPAALAAGHYTFAIEASNAGGVVTKPVTGVGDVAFTVK